MDIYVIISSIDGFTIEDKHVVHITVFAESKKSAIKYAKTIVDNPEYIMNAQEFDEFCTKHAEFVRNLPHNQN